MRQSRIIGIRIKGGKIATNMKQLEQDFAKSITFGKAPPTATAEQIKKKFSI